MEKTIILNESQYAQLTNEGIDWSVNDGGKSVNLSINKDNSDSNNLKVGGMDTRIFGSRDDILYGDGTNSKAQSLSDTVLGRRATITTYGNLISYIQGGRKGNVNRIFSDKNLPYMTKNAILKWLKDPNMSDDEIIQRSTRYINDWLGKGIQKDELYNRIVKNQDPKKTKFARYTCFNIPGTNVKCIGLFRMGSFDFSDAVKHGSIRNTGKLSTMLGFDNEDSIPVTYDGSENAISDVSRNFSLNDIGKINKSSNRDHFKNVSQYGMNGNEKYNSVNQFLDKSVMYAKYALNEQGYSPDVIVTTPSSSKMNEYYATNLSNKLGVTYIKDFFKRDIVNARLKDGVTDEDLLNRGFTEKDIMELKHNIKRYAYNEIIYEIERPLREFLKRHYEDCFAYLNKVKYERNSEKLTFGEILNSTSRICFALLKPMAEWEDKVCRHLARYFMQVKSYKEDAYLVSQIKAAIRLKGLTKEFDKVLYEMNELLKQYSKIVYQEGYKLRFGVSPSKITKLDQRYRPYVQGSFIIADKNLNENGELFNRLKNSKFLIVDEDVNSGASFKLSIDALEEKMPLSNEQNILCLANGFSESGL